MPCLLCATSTGWLLTLLAHCETYPTWFLKLLCCMFKQLTHCLTLSSHGTHWWPVDAVPEPQLEPPFQSDLFKYVVNKTHKLRAIQDHFRPSNCTLFQLAWTMRKKCTGFILAGLKSITHPPILHHKMGCTASIALYLTVKRVIKIHPSLISW